MKRKLTNKEISILEERGCTAENWSEIHVDDGFMANNIRNVNFYGKIEIGAMLGMIDVEEGFQRRSSIQNATLNNVTIGDNCLIENVHGYISNYHIENNCYLSNIGIISAQGTPSFGNGTVISVLNEGGDGNVMIYDKLTAQIAWLMIHFPSVRELAQQEIMGYPKTDTGTIGHGCRIVGIGEISNANIYPYCEIQGTSHISNVTLLSSSDAPSFIGPDVILENSVVAMGATVTDGAKVDNCFVGESVHIGKGFSAEASLFFANAYMDNGESCAALCGPFACSHHKSTLLIGGEFSFYNAGSGTNQSNHAYKMGPIHWGTLERGSKTASGSHILWPAHIGVFSMVMGKLTSHPRLRNLPFSYVLATGEKTYIVPGINIKTVGTWRDINKWPKRDGRPESARRDIINFSFPNPYIIQFVIAGKELLTTLQEQQGYDVDEYKFEGCYIKHKALVDGLRYYDLTLRLYSGSLPTDEWLDLYGMIAPKKSIEDIVSDIEEGDIKSSDEIVEKLKMLFAQNKYIYSRPQTTDYAEAESKWLDMVRRDAEKEFALGDVEEQQLIEFLAKVK